jgi:hypothetical protein
MLLGKEIRCFNLLFLSGRELGVDAQRSLSVEKETTISVNVDDNGTYEPRDKVF